MKQYNVVLNKNNWQALRVYLINNGIKYEPAGYYDMVYITVWCNENQAANINRFLEV